MSKKYKIILKTDKPMDWVEEFIKQAVYEVNNTNYRGFGFIPPIKKFKVKKSKSVK